MCHYKQGLLHVNALYYLQFNFMFFFLCQTSKNSLSELEKRERRAMERKLSEMEEELKVSIHNTVFCVLSTDDVNSSFNNFAFFLSRMFQFLFLI